MPRPFAIGRYFPGLHGVAYSIRNIALLAPGESHSGRAFHPRITEQRYTSCGQWMRIDRAWSFRFIEHHTASDGCRFLGERGSPRRPVKALVAGDLHTNCPKAAMPFT